MFIYIETIFSDPDRQRSIKIGVEGKTHLDIHNFKFFVKISSMCGL
jgi:hypothetical protein